MSSGAIYDVAIIGGGLAGLSLSIQLADAGYSCALFEKNGYPFHKVCGEYISNESKDFLERLGLDLKAMDLPQIKRLHVSSPSGKLMKHELGMGGFGISRYALDEKLALLAKQKGVVLMEDCKVNEVSFGNDQFVIRSSSGDFVCRACCGAWGKKSNMDNQLKREKLRSKENYIGIKYHVQVEMDEDLIELHNFKDGYCGISKVEGNKYCLCYLSNSGNLKKHNNDVKEMEKQVLMQNPFLKKHFSEAKFLYSEPLAISNISIGEKGAVTDHILLAGDAAGNIAPLSGNGMSMALRSSKMLMKLLRQFLDKKIDREELEEEYTWLWEQQFRKRIAFSKILQGMLKNTTLTDAAISLLSRSPYLRDKIVRSTHGKPF